MFEKMTVLVDYLLQLRFELALLPLAISIQFHTTDDHNLSSVAQAVDITLCI